VHHLKLPYPSILNFLAKFELLIKPWFSSLFLGGRPPLLDLLPLYFCLNPAARQTLISTAAAPWQLAWWANTWQHVCLHARSGLCPPKKFRK
jgi:hypothetical protein